MGEINKAGAVAITFFVVAIVFMFVGIMTGMYLWNDHLKRDPKAVIKNVLSVPIDKQTELEYMTAIKTATVRYEGLQKMRAYHQQVSQQHAQQNSVLDEDVELMVGSR